MAEALAARDGLVFARQAGFSDVILETDCLVLAKTLSSEQPDKSMIIGT